MRKNENSRTFAGEDTIPQWMIAWVLANMPPHLRMIHASPQPTAYATVTQANAAVDEGPDTVKVHVKDVETRHARRWEALNEALNLSVDADTVEAALSAYVEAVLTNPAPVEIETKDAAFLNDLPELAGVRMDGCAEFMAGYHGGNLQHKEFVFVDAAEDNQR